MLNFTLTQSFLTSPNSFFYLALALAGATLIGEVFYRLLRVPRIVGYAFSGLVAGSLNLPFEGLSQQGALRIVVDVALALLLFELGYRVNPRWLRANPWLIVTSLLEAGLTAAFVTLLLVFAGYEWPIVLVVSCIAICTSPAIVMRVVTETGARGQVTERLLLHTALNTVFALVSAKLALGWMLHQYRGDMFNAAVHSLYLICGSFLLAIALAYAVRLLNRYFDLREEQGSLLLFALLLLTISFTGLIKLSPLIVPLFAGTLLRVLSPRPLVWARHFGTAGGMMVVLLFVITGLSLRMETMLAGGAIGVGLILIRLLAKVIGSVVFAIPSGITLKQGIGLGCAMAPMSGIALVMAFDFHDIFPEINTNISAIVFSAIAILELIGPVVTQQTLRWMGELHR